MSEPTPPAGVVRSRAARIALMAGGFVAVAFGAIGIVVPGWPTTIWLLIAAYLFARSSPRFHRWLIQHRLFGPFIRDVQAGRGMPRRAKVVAISMIVIFAGSSAVLVGSTVRIWLGVLIAVLGAVGIVSVLRVPTRRPDPTGQSSSTNSRSAGPPR